METLSNRITTADLANLGLTPQQREQYETYGVLVLPGILPPDFIAKKREVFARHHEHMQEKLGLNRHTRYDSSRVLEIDPELLDLIDHPLILPKVIELLGTNIFLYHTQFNALPVTTTESAPNYFSWHWHQDNEQLVADTLSKASPRFTVKVAYLFSDVMGDEGGNTWYVPGSQYADRKPPVDPVDTRKLVGAVPIRATAGSAVIMDTRLWHCGTPNHGSITRFAIWLGYGFRWLRRYGDLGNLEALRSACDLVRAQLLDLEGSEQYIPEYVSDRYSNAGIASLPLTRLAGIASRSFHVPSVQVQGTSS